MPGQGMLPRQSPTTHTEILDDEVCVYEWTRKEVHALNATAARVWRICDGRTSAAEMIERLQPDWSATQAEAIVGLALAEFDQKHLLSARVDAPPDDRQFSRRDLIRRLGLAAATLPVITSIVAPAVLEAASVSGSQTFSYTGAQQTFTVPTGVTSLTVTAHGAQGGDGGGLSGNGGQGGTITATVSVTSGEALYIYVGGAGGTSTSGVAAGGFNGGGASGGAHAGGGGGASDIRQGGAALSNRIVVAGAGGGASAIPANGGNGGGTTGAAGSAAGGATGGGGGTQSAGGAAGTGPIQNGNPGTLGAGGDGVGTSLPSGGGGGGYWGGGSGGDDSAAGGGGGGSSYAEPGATSVTNTQGGHSGNGQVVLIW